MFNPRALYSVKSTMIGEDFEFLAIDVQIGTDPRGVKWIGFHDTGRGHQIEGDIVEDLPMVLYGNERIMIMRRKNGYGETKN